MKKILSINKKIVEVVEILLGGFIAGLSFPLFSNNIWLLYIILVIAVVAWVIMKISEKRTSNKCPYCGKFLKKTSKREAVKKGFP